MESKYFGIVEEFFGRCTRLICDGQTVIIALVATF